MKNLDGKEIKLSQFKDKFILLNFIGTYSATSQKEVVVIEKLYQKFKENENNKDKALVVLGITAEKDATKVKGFATKYKITFPILIEAVQTFKDYKVNQLPTIFYINKNGVIFSVHSGPVTYDEKKMEAEINKILSNASAPKEAGQQIICD